MTKRFLAVRTLLVLALATGATGAVAQTAPSTFDSARWNRIIEAAKKEGEVTLYSTNTPDQLQILQAGFEKKYPGIKMGFFRGLQPVIESRIDSERQSNAGGADVVTVPWDPWFGQMSQTGEFLPPLGPMPVSSDWRNNKYLKSNYAATNFFVIGMAWNTKVLGAPIKSYQDLLRPELANGKLGIVQPQAPSIMDFYTFLEDQYGEEFLRKLAAQKPRIYPSAVPLAQNIVAGEVGAGNFITPGILDDKNRGAPVEFIIPSPAWSLPTNSAILKSSKHPNAAQLLMDHMMSREGQEALARAGASAIKGISTAIVDPDRFRPQNLERFTPEFLKQSLARWGRIFTP